LRVRGGGVWRRRRAVGVRSQRRLSGAARGVVYLVSAAAVGNSAAQ